MHSHTYTQSEGKVALSHYAGNYHLAGLPLTKSRPIPSKLAGDNYRGLMWLGGQSEASQVKPRKRQSLLLCVNLSPSICQSLPLSSPLPRTPLLSIFRPTPPPFPQTEIVQHLACLEITGFPLTPSWRYNPFISVYKYISAELLEAPCLSSPEPPHHPPTASAALSHEKYCMCVFKEDALRAEQGQARADKGD